VLKSILKRLLLLVLTVLLVTVLAFVAFSIIPGDPTDAILGLNATEEQVAALRAELGLDLPIHIRYWKWISAFVTGDFGTSYNFDLPVAQLIAPKVGVTLTLAAMAFVLIVVISLPLGILAARHEGGWLDKVLTVLNQITMSVPNFVVGIVLMLIFGYILSWFAPGGFTYPSEGVGKYLWFMLFPALSVALPKSAMTVKMLRGSVLSEMSSDYIRTARSKGNTRTSILWRHVLRNAMIPVVTFLATTIAEIVAGSIVVEQVFAVPGMGSLLISSIGNQDYPVVQAIIVIVAVVVVLCNFLADLLYRVMDPRIKGR
jgi:peptide/nickel transport system permease protein